MNVVHCAAAVEKFWMLLTFVSNLLQIKDDGNQMTSRVRIVRAQQLIFISNIGLIILVDQPAQVVCTVPWIACNGKLSVSLAEKYTIIGGSCLWDATGE